MGMILHICSKRAWAAAQASGEYRGDTLATEGFIHCSTPGQVVEVANSIFKGGVGLILLVIDEREVLSEIRYEDADNGKLYPHIYGALNLGAVSKVADFLPKADGNFELPELSHGRARAT